MIEIRGQGVSGGIASGPLYVYRRAGGPAAPRERIADVAAEIERLKAAQARAIEQLGELADRAREAAGDDAASLFETHQMMVEDPDYVEAIERGIREGAMRAEAAVADAGEDLAGMFAAMDDAYMRERAADVRDVSGRIIAILSGEQSAMEIGSPAILVADDLSPSETIQLDRTKILGFVTEGGSATAHTAILARGMGIPAVVGARGILAHDLAGREAIIDGGTGTVAVDPDEPTRARMAQERAERQERREALDALKGAEDVTRDGRRVRVYCNIGSPDDVASVLENDGRGIGLFRSEFLYLGRDSAPSEDEQFEAYRDVLARMEGKEVIIRTMDIGSDKQVEYLGLPHETDPAMGLRALRICLERPDLFRTQLRALYRASAFGRLLIMFPMVASVWEVREAKAMCEQVIHELDTEGVPHGDVPLGIMIETPAAALISDRLAELVDFFSCGTNDLTQYTLACARGGSGIERSFDPHHLAVLRLLKIAADAAHAGGIWIGVCGDLAADLEMTETFLALGIDELSVPPSGVLPLRERVRSIDVASAREGILAALMDDRPASHEAGHHA